MRILATKITHSDEARAKLLAGAERVYKMVASTLGPQGRNNIIEQKGKPPIITNDGFYTIRAAILDEETENLGNESLANVAKQQNREVGDGTTTAVVLAYDLIQRVFRQLKEQKDDWSAKKENVIAKRREILAAIPKIVAEIKAAARLIETKEDIKNVAFTSFNDEEKAEIVADMVHKLGKDGSISVEEGFGQETQMTMISGYKFIGKYVDDKLATNDRWEAVIEDPFILITNEYIETPQALGVVIEWLIKNHGKTGMVIIAEGFSRDVIGIVAKNRENYDAGKGGFNCLAVKAGSATIGVYEDIAICTGGTFFDKNIGNLLTKCIIEKPGIGLPEFGKAKKIVVDREKTFIIEGKGDRENIAKRVVQLKEQMEVEKHPDFKKNLEKRVSALTGGVGLIEVASKSDLETEYLIGKIEDTVCACKAAMQEGVVKGGGLCLKEIADKLEDGSIVKETLKRPYELIQENAGGKLEIPENVSDPAKVVRMAVEHAFTFAASFITIENSVAWARHQMEDMMMEKLRETFQDTLDKNKGAK